MLSARAAADEDDWAKAGSKARGAVAARAGRLEEAAPAAHHSPWQHLPWRRGRRRCQRVSRRLRAEVVVDAGVWPALGAAEDIVDLLVVLVVVERYGAQWRSVSKA